MLLRLLANETGPGSTAQVAVSSAGIHPDGQNRPEIKPCSDVARSFNRNPVSPAATEGRKGVRQPRASLENALGGHQNLNAYVFRDPKASAAGLRELGPKIRSQQRSYLVFTVTNSEAHSPLERALTQFGANRCSKNWP